jgi:[acyl-carrier-protein] S-malonyltransferase
MLPLNGKEPETMTLRAMLFPGQGAQYPGMGKAFAEAYPEAAALFDRADEVLGFELKKTCFQGPEEEVHRTDVCQPGILTTSLAILEVLKNRHGLKPGLFSATAGLSLGEYTALVFAGVLDFEDAVQLVAKRGRYMQEDSDRHPSGMMTLLGTTEEQAEAICRKASSAGVIVSANFLAPSQIAVSGSLEALDVAEGLLKEEGVKRGIRLRVAGAFHSPLMEEGGRKLKAELAKVDFRTPAIGFASNVTGDFVKDPESIRDYLGLQVTSPVRWADIMTRFVDHGLREYYEPGPGKVLTGIMKKVDRSASGFNADTPEEIDSFAEGWSGGEKEDSSQNS